MVELVCQEVAGTAGKAPALSFLAAVARDHGAVPQALMLFRWPAISALRLPVMIDRSSCCVVCRCACKSLQNITLHWLFACNAKELRSDTCQTLLKGSLCQ